MQSRSITSRHACLAALAMGTIALGFVGGCRTSTAGSLTPEMRTTSQRQVDARNQRALTFNENWRMFWGDVTRATLTDRPSRLTPEPVPW